MMGRYFFALWPDEDIRRQLEAVSDGLPGDCGRKVRSENLHITLVFLGNIEDAVMERMRSVVDGIKCRTFTLTLNLYGWWKRPRVIWLGTDTVPGALEELASHLNSVAAEHDVHVDSRPYAPHLTLVRKAKRPLAGFSYGPIHWQIRDFCLVQSITRAAGAEYRVVQNWPLT